MFKNVLTLLVYIIIMKAFISLWKITRLELSLKEARTEKKNVKNMQYSTVLTSTQYSCVLESLWAWSQLRIVQSISVGISVYLN